MWMLIVIIFQANTALLAIFPLAIAQIEHTFKVETLNCK